MSEIEIGEELENTFCQSCSEQRQRKGLERRELVVIGFTERQNLPVLVCPYCDSVNTPND
jgi:DNA-directed RNA polymerase subunit RPC12/RpoP